jgi:DMSO reductase anchor subunit
MSREILVFGAFAPLAILYAASFWLPRWVTPLERGCLSAAVAATGMAGIYCSVLIYHVTRRAWWTAPRTAFKFFMTAVVLGLATAELTLSIGVHAIHAAREFTAPVLVTLAARVAQALLVAGVVKGAGEVLALRHLRDPKMTDLRRSAVLLTRDLSTYTVWRFLALAAGLLVTCAAAAGHVSAPAAAVVLVVLTIGELLERTLFFAAMCSPGMPGGLG